MWVVSTFLLILFNAIKSAKSPDFNFMFDWFKRNADWRVQVDNCCQRAKVHRLVTLPEQSYKMSWSCCGFFSGVCVNFEYLEIWIHYFSKSNSAPHYFSKSNSAHHYFSKSNSAHHYLGFSKCKQALIFILNVSQRFSQILCWVSTCIFSLIVSQRAFIYSGTAIILIP